AARAAGTSARPTHCATGLNAARRFSAALHVSRVMAPRYRPLAWCGGFTFALECMACPDYGAAFRESAVMSLSAMSGDLGLNGEQALYACYRVLARLPVAGGVCS